MFSLFWTYGTVPANYIEGKYLKKSTKSIVFVKYTQMKLINNSKIRIQLFDMTCRQQPHRKSLFILD